MLTREIYTKGQVVIPKEIRDAFNFQPGTEVVFEIKQEGALIKRKRSIADEIMEMRKEDATMTTKEIKKLMKGYKEYKAAQNVY